MSRQQKPTNKHSITTLRALEAVARAQKRLKYAQEELVLVKDRLSDAEQELAEAIYRHSLEEEVDNIRGIK